jgi:hypothetical protein
MKYQTKYGFKVEVEIIRNEMEDKAIVIVHCPFYITKQFTMPHRYKASHFSDYDILNDCDFIRIMLSHFPNK